MPALYAHYRFGARVAGRLEGDLKGIIQKYHAEFAIGLQGPDIFFFYRPLYRNRVVRVGTGLHAKPVRPFLEHALTVVDTAGRDSREYAYILGFICHFILDSECHPYVNAYRDERGVSHLEIEEEFEKKLLRMDHKDALSYPISKHIPTSLRTARAICPFYEEVTIRTVRESLFSFKLIKKLFTAPSPVAQAILNTLLHLSGDFSSYKGLMNQRIDNPACEESGNMLLWHFHRAIPLAVSMIQAFDDSFQKGDELPARFDRTFE